MEGLRGLAVFLVFLVHYYALFGFLLASRPTQARIASFLADIGQSGVDLFFVMSGFLIYAAALKPSLRYLSFMKRRIVRIYPTFLSVLSIYLLLSYCFPKHSRLPSHPLDAAIYIAENVLLLPGMLAITPLITVSWSLSYEMFYYLSLPAITLALSLSTWTYAKRVVLILFTSVMFVYYLGSNGHIQLLMFLGGMLLYEMSRSKPLQNRLSPGGEIAVTILFLAALGVSGTNCSFQVRTLILVLGIVPFALFCFQFDGWISSCFKWWPLRAWGNISYSYYLLHGLILNALLLLWPMSAQAPYWYWLFLPFALVATLIASFILFILVERPLSLRPKPQSFTRTAAATRTNSESIQECGLGTQLKELPRSAD